MKVALAREGHYFAGDGIEFHWGRGGGERLTGDVPDDRSEWSAKLTKAFETGLVVEVSESTKAAAPKAKPKARRKQS